MSNAHPLFRHAFSDLLVGRGASSRRASSWDRSGGNRDFLTIGPGETAVLLDESGPGCVTHLYCAMVLPDLRDYRNAVLRCFWDGATAPSVEVPLGDFFALAHARTRELQSAFVAVNPGVGSTYGLNAYFPMPFASGARVTLENRGSAPLGGALGALWFHVDYELYDAPLPVGVDRFHACYRQERRTAAVGGRPNVTHHDGRNVDGSENYVALDTAGAGRMVGLVLEIENRQGATWYGEGDDMVFIDGGRWPPSIHGTGTEEIFGGGACPAREYAGPYSGFHLVESERFDGLVGMYRWYVHDPIHFSRSLRWTIEHGHANNFANAYASVAYWYQSPRAVLPPLPPHDELEPPLDGRYDAARDALFAAARRALQAMATDPDRAAKRLFAACRAGDPLYRGDFAAAIAAIQRLDTGG